MEYDDLKTAGEALEITEEISILTSGCSMQPMLRQHRDLVIVKRISRPLKKGDVVLYPGSDGKFILHRIVAVKKGRFIIRGDNNYFTERDVETKSIVGVLKEFYREGKYINCETDKRYKAYTFYILHSYHLRYLWKRILKPILSKIKRLFIK